MLHIKVAEAAATTTAEQIEHELFSTDYLIKRPLLEAIQSGMTQPTVLLIDEVDRSDEEFEAFLLEVLSDFQITIPEVGTIKTTNPPVVVITSNRTREVHDALKRRCLYYWIDYPSFEKELEIVQTQLPNAPAQLARQITGFIQALREMDLYKLPGVAETLDWTTALVALDQSALDPSIVDETLGAVLKYQDDVEKVKGGQARAILERIKAGVD
jgi:MoxR-like ATPase